ncbi:MAG: hypothetical protein IKS83_04105 [Victivallales bacterium]|nr:hypothetical protein [Victivallales bacterium]
MPTTTPTVTRYNASDELTVNSFARPSFASVTLTVSDASDEMTAVEAALNYASKNLETNGRYRGLFRNGTDAIEMLAPHTWRVKLLYGVRHSHLSGTDSDTDSSVSFESASESVNVVVPISTFDSAGATGHPGVINPDENGQPRGVQIESSYLVRTETKVFSNSKFSAKYQDTLSSLIDHVNLYQFRGYQPGEVLFTHFSGKQNGGPKGDWTVTFTFKIRRNKTHIDCGKGTDDDDYPSHVYVDKRGWDVLWVIVDDYVCHADSQSKGPVEKRTYGAFADQVYEEADFGLLKLGGR